MPLVARSRIVNRPRSPLIRAGLLACSLLLASIAHAAPPDSNTTLQKGDRVAFVGSSSTRIGIWPRTVEFLLRTRHPQLDLHFQRFTTGGGTFATGLEHYDEWLGRLPPHPRHLQLRRQRRQRRPRRPSKVQGPDGPQRPEVRGRRALA